MGAPLPPPPAQERSHSGRKTSGTHGQRSAPARLADFGGAATPCIATSASLSGGTGRGTGVQVGLSPLLPSGSEVSATCPFLGIRMNGGSGRGSRRGQRSPACPSLSKFPAKLSALWGNRGGGVDRQLSFLEPETNGSLQPTGPGTAPTPSNLI